MRGEGVAAGWVLMWASNCSLSIAVCLFVCFPFRTSADNRVSTLHKTYYPKQIPKEQMEVCGGCFLIVVSYYYYYCEITENTASRRSGQQDWTESVVEK